MKMSPTSPLLPQRWLSSPVCWLRCLSLYFLNWGIKRNLMLKLLPQTSLFFFPRSSSWSIIREKDICKYYNYQVLEPDIAKEKKHSLQAFVKTLNHIELMYWSSFYTLHNNNLLLVLFMFILQHLNTKTFWKSVFSKPVSQNWHLGEQKLALRPALPVSHTLDIYVLREGFKTTQQNLSAFLLSSYHQVTPSTSSVLKQMGLLLGKIVF